MHKCDAKDVVIANGGTTSTPIDFQDYNDIGQMALVGIAMPGTVDVQTLQVQFSFDNSTWYELSRSNN